MYLNLTITSPELSKVGFVAALPGGGAVARHYINDDNTEEILKINSQGKVTQTIYTCVQCSSYVWGLLLLGDHLYITHSNGTVLKTRVSDGQLLSTSIIPDVSSVIHRGSLSNKPDRVPDKQTLLLCDRFKGEVFTFKPSTGQKQVRVTGLQHPQSVSYFFYNNTVYYIVCEQGRNRITLYNNTWDLIRTVGRYGHNDGELNYPMSAVVSNEDTIIISDYHNNRVSEFSFNGTFLHHLLHRSDGIDSPLYMSYYYPHLWMSHGYDYKIYRYNLYR